MDGREPAASELERFRASVAEWIDAHCPPALRGDRAVTAPPVWGGSSQVFDDDSRAWLDAMADRGWTAPTWPRAYGGGGLDDAEAAVLEAELRRAKARPPLVRVNPGLTMIGPLLLQHGTEDQRRRHLPPIARGAVRWCQGFSEPDAGSDLAGVRTRAEAVDGGYLVNGQKIWSSYAHVSDWIFALVRSEPDVPKHDALSLLLIDLDTPGIEVRPIELISGRSDFCEVFLTDVLVPATNLVGERGAGWPLARRLLEHERSMLGSAGSALSGGGRRAGPRELLVERCEAPAAAAPLLRDEIAAHEIRVHALRATARRYAGERRGEGWAASLLKVVSTENHMQRQDLIQEVLGLDALLVDGDGVDPTVAQEWLRSRANSIEGGTTEVQLNIIARQALGLPRG